jgi:hypothetical protein
MLQVILLLLLLFSINSFAAIGTITEGKGSSEIQREKTKLNVKQNIDVESLDIVSTANGIVGITFKDDTKVRVTEHSKLVIDDFVYDPKSKGAGKLAMKVALGTVRYASGSIAHENNKNVDIKTPTATIAVRGTAFTMTVNEIGQSLIILLPNADGSVGEIEVQTKMGLIILNQAFQATMVTGSEIKPLKPVLLSLSESMINNMLIVKPPKEILEQMRQDVDSSSDSLSFTELDKNMLDVKVWKDEFKFNELDMNELDFSYLTNNLDQAIMNALQIGYNASTSVYVFDKGTNLQVDRHIKHDVTIIISKEKGYDITLIQDSTVLTLKNMESTTNKLTIKQGSK